MKKIIYALIILLSIVLRANSQTPAITIEIDRSISNYFYCYITAKEANTNIQVDLGNGTLTNFSIGTTDGSLYGTALGDTIKIYGLGITRLNIDWGNKYTALNITGATDLLELSCRQNKITTLDLSQNTLLSTLTCPENQIETLDLSHNTALTIIDCSRNLLTTIDVSKNLALKEFYCQSNNFTFSSLPIKQTNWTYYVYSPQLPLILNKRKFAIGELVDLSSQLNINGSTTLYIWKTESGTTLVEGIDYTEDNGMFAFLVNQDVNIYCQMTNATFPNLTLTTEMITIPSSTIAVTMATSIGIGNTFTFDIAASTDSKTIQIDWGNNVLSDYIIGSSNSNISGRLTGDTIRIYGLDITDLNLQSKRLTSLNVSEATELKTLICSSNKLTELNLINNHKLTNLQCQSNQLTTLNLSNESDLSTILCQSNQLSTINLPSNVSLIDFQCQLNQLNLNALPVKQANWINYTYSPQQTIKLPLNKYEAPEYICLNDQLIIDGKTTSYTWKTKGGIMLSDGVDYISYYGRFNFLRIPNDSIFCELTNATFPDLTITTKPIAIALSSPVIFMTTTAPIGSTFSFNIYPIIDYYPIFVDWGDGELVRLKVEYGTLKGNTIKFYGKNIRSLCVSSKSITALDISGATELIYLYCDYNQLTTLDISKNKELNTLYCNNNQLTTFNANNEHVGSINCSRNLLTSLDVSKCTALNNLNCNFNQLTFFSLPLKQPQLQFYVYQYQAKIKLSKEKYDVGEVIDLSNQKIINGFNTQFLWKTAGGATLIEGIDYSEDNGNFTFLVEQCDYIYCQMTNENFPLLIQTTEIISVYSLQTNPFITLETSTLVGESFSFGIESTVYEKPIQVDWGNGIITDCTIDNFGNVNGNLSGDTIKIYGIGIKSFFVVSENITDLKMSSTNILSILDCHSNQLTSIDISKATALETLDCSSNQLTSLEIKSSSLKSLNCSSNQLTSLDISRDPSLHSLNCRLNQLTFNTLPLINNLNDYIYYPQQPYKLPKTEYEIDEIIDISNLYNSNGYITTYTWRTNEILTSPVRYSYYNGLFKFQDPCKNIFCQMTNESFPSLTIYTENINIGSTTSIVDNALNVSIFPNPIQDILNIESKESITKIEVYTITGVKIYEKQGDNTLTMAIPTADFPRGLLIVKVYGRNGVIDRKVIKE